jgi:general stress protein 26
MTTRQEHIEKLRDLIHSIDFAMLTTVDEDDTLRSRPMSTQEVDFDGDLWFFTRDDTAKVFETARNRNVNVSYAAPSKNVYVSMSGLASISYDRAKIQEYWSPVHKAWFPDGPDDPHLALLKVEVSKAEYWESPAGIAQVITLARAILSGDSAEAGENEKINLG